MRYEIDGAMTLCESELVSVVMPALNAAAYIASAIESALAQTYSKFELIVVDDGSTDLTPQIVAEFLDKDPRVILVRNHGKGVSAARNTAVALARGRYIAPLDADDLWHHRKLELQLAALQKASRKVGVVYCWSAGIDDNNRILLPTWNTSTARGTVLDDIIASGIVGNGSVPLIRKEIIERAGGFDESLALCEDWKFYTALAGVCEFEMIPLHLVGYRMRSDSSSINVDAMTLAIDNVTEWIRNQWPELNSDILRERAFTVDNYLAVLAIRQRRFSRAVKFLLSAARCCPNRVHLRSYWQLWILLLAHLVGIRVFRWDFWNRPQFDPCVDLTEVPKSLPS